MAQNQTKNLPSVSEVLLKANKYKSINRRYLSYIIKNELTNIYVQKVKFRHIGELGEAQFKYNLQNGRYSEVGESLDDHPYIPEVEKNMLLDLDN